MSGGRRSATIAAAAVAFTLVWIVLHPATPSPPDSDLYTHLATARHLVRGEGFLNDVVYPLSLSFPFADRAPQPLIHRPPGYPVLLTLPVGLSGDDPHRAEVLTRLLQAALLGLTVAAGMAALQRRGRLDAALPWCATLLLSPLLAMTAGWSQVETPVALLLLLLWVRRRDGATPSASATVFDGLLAAAVALLRTDLIWVPWLWLLLTGCRGRALLRTAAVWALVMAPWWVRNLVVTGQPFFALQAYAEHLKGTAQLPGYAAYLRESPEWLGATLLRRPDVLFGKAVQGLVYYLARLDNWLPWGMLAAGVAAAFVRRPGGARTLRPTALLAGTLALMVIVYAPFSHDLRHLAVLLPAAAWELWLLLADRLREVRPAARPSARAAVLVATAALALALTPARLPGWDQARERAIAAAPGMPTAVARCRDLPPGPILTDSAALLWHARRAGVWWPREAGDAAQLRRHHPWLAEAPFVMQAPD
ncbi:MAG: hypothetical protein Q7W56_04780 [Candidatus Latescibacteria bacterium]|nr:hypothetical protein [Candidatus Latescibacterota bacterium]